MSSYCGSKIQVSIFGESHGKAIGVNIDNLPSGVKIDMEKVLLQMGRRAPGKDKAATPRKEADTPIILSGMLENTTTGAPLCAIIENTNTRSTDYSNLMTLPRPSHSDYPAYIKYQGFNDIRGGGHFSGRLTAPLVFAGSVCRQILQNDGIEIVSHINSIKNISDERFNQTNIDLELIKRLNNESFPVINKEIEAQMRNEIETARMEQDSVGGIIECGVVGFKAGVGSPMFMGVENVISSVMFGVPAVKGIEFGSGFDITKLNGSQSNDEYFIDNGQIKTKTNHNGGVLGGITNGMPIICRVAIKPTPSISKEQNTINLQNNQNEKLIINGRHDPCILSRASVVVESAMAIALINLL